MKNNMLRKGLILGIILLFVGASVTPSISGDFENKTDSNTDFNFKPTEQSITNDVIVDSEPDNVDWWPIFQHDLLNSGYSSNAGPDINNTRLTYPITGYPTSPAVVNGKLYITIFSNDDNDNYLLCLDIYSGEEIWTAPLHKYSWCSPTVHNGKVYVAHGSSGNGKITCFDAENGDEIWSFTPFEPDCYHSPIVVNGKAYFGDADGFFYSLNADNGALNGYNAISYPEGIYCSPSFVDGKLYVSSFDGKIFCLDEIYVDWEIEIDGDFFCSSPTVIYDKLYIGSKNGKEYCIDTNTKEILWEYQTEDCIYSTQAVAEGKVYIGSWDNKLYCLDATNGDLIWEYDTGDNMTSPPSVADGKVYFGSSSCYVFCLDATNGDLIWEYETGGRIDWSPAIVDGEVYIGSDDFHIYCFGEAGENQPPDKPNIYGPDEVEIGFNRTYSGRTTDQNGDKICLMFDWGDGTSSNWGSYGLFGGWAWDLESHSYECLGEYSIKVKAKDEHGLESEWSDPLVVNVVYTGLLRPGSNISSKCWRQQYGAPPDNLVIDVASLGVEYVCPAWIKEFNEWQFLFRLDLFRAQNSEWFNPDDPPGSPLERADAKQFWIDWSHDNDCGVLFDSSYDIPGGYNVKDLLEIPDNNFPSFAIDVCSAAVSWLLKIPQPFTTIITTGAQLAVFLEDAMDPSSTEHNIIWEPLDYKNPENSGYAQVRVAVNPEAQHEDDWWEVTFDAGVDYILYGAFHPIGLSINTHQYGCYGEGTITFRGIIPPPLEEGQEPEDIFIRIYGEGGRTESPCPVDVVVYTAYNGFVISKNYTNYYGANYTEVDLDGDGDLDIETYIPCGWFGNYSIYAIPKPDADPDDTFTIIVESEGQNITLVEDMKISDVNITVPFVYDKPDPPWDVNIDGSTKGKPRQEYYYTFNSTTPLKIGVYEYLIDWGDNSTEQLITGPFEPGENVTVGHTWNEKGTYTIKAKAKDRLGIVSEWSEPLNINIEYPNPFLLGLISNVNESENFTTFEARKLFWLSFNPFDFRRYFSYETMIVLNDYTGWIIEPFILGRFKAEVTSEKMTSTFHPIRDRIRRFLSSEQ